MEKGFHPLARFFGIEPFYRDGTGKRHTVPVSTLQALLARKGIHVSSLADAQKALREAKLNQWRKVIDEVLVVYPSNKVQTFFIVLPIGDLSMERVKVEWVIQNERFKRKKFQSRGSACKVVATKSIQGVRHVRLALAYPRNIGLGYYQMNLKVTMGPNVIERQTFVIAAPRQCYLPTRPRRWWGVMVQLYGLRSQRNWGIGDYDDLQQVMKWVGRTLRAETVGVSPLHPPTPGVTSPYSPSSRLFLNPLYLHIERIPEFRIAPALQERVRSPSFQADLEKLRNSFLVNYEKVMALKWPIFEELFEAFQQHQEKFKTARALAFERYIQRHGKVLEQFSIFQVLTEHFGSSIWRNWPKGFQDPNSYQVEQFKLVNKDRIRFFQYLQWQCEEQLLRVKQMARRLGMPLGFYLDLPVGIHPDGSDAWMFQQHLASGLTVGAPPDSFNRRGQNWGVLAPLPNHMRTHQYHFFIETIKQNMRHGGVLRIDHAMGLFRLFVIPEGRSGKTGPIYDFPLTNC